jgi:hypothetical protein
VPAPARRSRLAVWLAPPAAVVAVVVIAVVVTSTLGAGGTPDHRRPAKAAASDAARSASTATTSPVGPTGTATTPPPSTTTTTAPTTTTTTVPATTTTTAALQGALAPLAGNGSRPQTSVQPTASTATFRAEMALLWDAIRTGRAGPAMPAFFPEAAYEQVKALGDDAADWTDRLVVHFRLDVAAAHAALGPGAASARFVEVLVPSQLIQWVAPGACYNTLGYWNVPGSRLVYEEGGQERSIGIASLISWRGYWYVVHLGSEVPPPDSGVVDNPSPGVGVFGPPGGC